MRDTIAISGQLVGGHDEDIEKLSVTYTYLT